MNIGTYLSFLPPLRWQDAVDILIVAYVAYRVALLIRGTRAAQMVLGFVILGLAFVASQVFGLFTVNWLLHNFLGNLIVILVVIFQADIRRVLVRVGSRRVFGFRMGGPSVADEMAEAAGWLSAHRVGGLIAIEREVGLDEYVEAGRPIDGRISAELIETIFMPGSPLHDGAVIVRGDQVLAAACLLPLASSQELSRTLGTRHRAAIGLSEESDAAVIVVSEEDGTISLARRGRLRRGLQVPELREALRRIEASDSGAGRAAGQPAVESVGDAKA